MKKHLISGIIAAAVILFAGSTAVFAAPVITENNINEGLAFCSEYPVTLTLENEQITFKESDVPPVIITPEGESAGRTLVPARALFEKAGAVVTWDEASQSVGVTYNSYTIRLTIGSQIAVVNGEDKELDVPAMIIDHDGDYYGSTMIPVRFVAENLNFGVAWDDVTRTVAVTRPPDENGNRGDGERPGDTTGTAISGNEGTTGSAYVIVEGIKFPEYDMSSLPEPTENAKSKLIAIDMGHGGKDPGAIAHKGQADQLYEKDINYAVGTAAGDLLKAAGINVYMIRESDIYVELKSRPYAANEINADFLVSFHNNSSENSNTKGSLVCYYTKTGENGQTENELYGIDSKTIAKAVQAEMVKALGTVDRGISSRPDLAVLNKSVMPAIIIEGAYLSNEDDLAMMRTDEYVKRYAFASAKAIIEAFNEAYPD